jgi:hypothetical protein
MVVDFAALLKVHVVWSGHSSVISLKELDVLLELLAEITSESRKCP